ncbi:hypothetical protein L873DRAFT_616546 [Choiromyces venosus 120613-1]|uniref:Uncharacterized protein n=1 Tax=Choiromyces venosus 120613-1 TaxID=1336337 RepID=A0A3N4IZP2_9PEZI|nr:hypothetical protein L873DRAFT_616546 [Choiromyces venosus 120613-1]
MYRTVHIELQTLVARQLRFVQDSYNVSINASDSTGAADRYICHVELISKIWRAFSLEPAAIMHAADIFYRPH